MTDSTDKTLCPKCGFLLLPDHTCPVPGDVQQSADMQPKHEDLDIEIAKPYVTMPKDEVLHDHEGNVVIPDVIGEVIGWRVWRVLHPRDPKNIKLQSLGAGGKQHSAIWTPGKIMEAFCPNPHEVPNEKCSCGFYAASSKEHLLTMSYHSGFNYDDPADVLVVGEVAMQGKIIPGTQGWRAQRVRPVRVYVLPSRWRVMKLLADAYPKTEFVLANWLTRPKKKKEVNS